MSNARIFISYSHRGNGPRWKAALLRALTLNRLGRFLARAHTLLISPLADDGMIR